MPCSRSRTGLIFIMILWAARNVPQIFHSGQREPVIGHKMVFSGTRVQRPTQHLRLLLANLNPSLPRAPASLCSFSVSLLLPTLLRPLIAQWSVLFILRSAGDQSMAKPETSPFTPTDFSGICSSPGRERKQDRQPEGQRKACWQLYFDMIIVVFIDWRLSDLGFVFPAHCKYP